MNIQNILEELTSIDDTQEQIAFYNDMVAEYPALSDIGYISFNELNSNFSCIKNKIFIERKRRHEKNICIHFIFFINGCELFVYAGNYLQIVRLRRGSVVIGTIVYLRCPSLEFVVCQRAEFAL